MENNYSDTITFNLTEGFIKVKGYETHFDKTYDLWDAFKYVGLFNLSISKSYLSRNEIWEFVPLILNEKLGEVNVNRLSNLLYDLLDHQKKLKPNNAFTLESIGEKIVEFTESIIENIATKNGIGVNKLTPRQLAFYIYFLIESKELEPFKGGTKIKEMKKICMEHNGVNDTNFQIKFNEISSNKNKTRTIGTANNINDLNVVCEMLKSHEIALLLAQQTLKQAENNKI